VGDKNPWIQRRKGDLLPKKSFRNKDHLGTRPRTDLEWPAGKIT